MIFCTVGTQFPFDRLIGYVNKWAVSARYDDIIFQVGCSSYYEIGPKYRETISEPEFTKRFTDAEIIISHAGMGNIIRTLDLDKAIVIVPRLASQGEHINDHQIDTAESLSCFPNIFIANNYDEFILQINEAFNYIPSGPSDNENLSSLIKEVSNFINKT